MTDNSPFAFGAKNDPSLGYGAISLKQWMKEENVSPDQANYLLSHARKMGCRTIVFKHNNAKSSIELLEGETLYAMTLMLIELKFSCWNKKGIQKQAASN